MTTMKLMDPTGGLATAATPTARRVESLSELRLGLLDNSKTNAAKFLTMVADILVERYGVSEVKMFHKEALSKPATPEVVNALVEWSDCAVTGIGDCGSCSTNSIHDGIETERRGVPCVAIATDAFRPGLDALTSMRGMPDYRFAIVPHPLGVLFDDELQERAELAAPKVAAILTGKGDADGAGA